MVLPVVYRRGGENLTFNVDFFDYAANAGYKKYYAACGQTSAAAQYFLTTDSGFVSDIVPLAITGNGTDKDFDITFNNAVTIAAADAYINYVQLVNTLNHTIYVTFTIYHVDSAGVETSLGSVVGPTDTGTGSATFRSRAAKIAMTQKTFASGDKLRFNIVLTTNDAAPVVYADPSGHISWADSADSECTSRMSVNIPFKIDL